MIVQGRRGLRFYLMAVFIPMMVCSLAIFAWLTLFQVGREIDKELGRRAKVEQLSFEQKLSVAERQLERDARSAVQNSELLIAVMSRSPNRLRQATADVLKAGHFDSIRLYSEDGLRLGTYTHVSPEGLERKWGQLLGSALDQREPAADPSTVQAHPNPYTNNRRVVLSKDFRRFLSDQGSWLKRRFESEPLLQFELVHYSEFFDSDRKSAGFLEAVVEIDAARLAVFSQAQGVELALFDPVSEKVIASQSLADTHVSKRIFSGLYHWVDTKLSDEELRFYTKALRNSSGELVAHAAVGLSRSERVNFQNTLLMRILGVGLLLSVLLSFFVVALSKKITRPISDLLKAVEGMRAGEWVQPVDAPKGSEIGFLVSRFNEMAQSVQVTKRTLEDKLLELAKSNDALELTRDHLIQTEKLSSLGELVAGVAHELNNPIAFIYSNMSQMQEYLKDIEKLDKLITDMKNRLDEESQKHIEQCLTDIEWDYLKGDMKDIVQSCLEGSNRVKDIVLGLRDFSRLDKGGMQEVDLEESFKSTANILRSQLKNKVQLHWQLCDDNMVYCNPSQINQVLLNLLNNAAQAIEQKGDIWITTEREPGSHAYIVRVRDNGKGISSEMLGRIFDPFFTTKKVGEGTGLGLSIVYGIVDRHKGNIEVSSRLAPHPQQGTEFVIRLPQKRSTEEAIAV